MHRLFRYETLVLFRALEGLGEAFYFPASVSLISAYHGTESRSRAMAFHQSSVYAGTIAGGVGGWVPRRVVWLALRLLFVRRPRYLARAGSGAALA